MWLYPGICTTPPNEPLRANVIGRLIRVLDADYTILVPKTPGYYDFSFTDVKPGLPALTMTETADYEFYRKKLSNADSTLTGAPFAFDRMRSGREAMTDLSAARSGASCCLTARDTE